MRRGRLLPGLERTVMEEIKAAVDPQAAVEQLGRGIARRESSLRRSHDSGGARWKPGRTKLVEEGLRGECRGNWAAGVVVWCGAGAWLRLKGSMLVQRIKRWMASSLYGSRVKRGCFAMIMRLERGSFQSGGGFAELKITSLPQARAAI